MTKVSRAIVVLTGTVVLTLSGGPIAPTFAGGGADDRRGGASGTDAVDQAMDAALAATGGGRVTGTELDDEKSYYEFEVTLDDSRQLDVQVDESLEVVSISSSAENPPVPDV